MKSAIAVRHVAFENLGSWENLIQERYHLEYVDALNLPLLDNAKIDLLVVLGGPIGVYQEEEYPFLSNEITIIKQRLQSNLPTLGICLGSQLIARALDAKVYPNHTKEIGWIPLHISEHGLKSSVRHLDGAPMFHWHGDTFDLPSGAKLLASTSHCQNQIFSWKNHALAFQCHPEVTAQGLEAWWVGHAAELSHNKLSVSVLRNESIKLSASLEKQSACCIEEWLDSLEKF